MKQSPPKDSDPAGIASPDGDAPALGVRPAAVEVTVLGSVGVRRDGEPVEVAPRLRRLLAGLVVNCGDVVSTDRLIDIVWDGDEPTGADKAVRTYVSRLRRVLGDEHEIVHRQPGYVLELSDAGLDSALFDDELDRALSLLRTADHDDAMRLLDVTTRRWSGPAFAGFAEEEWARPEAVRLEERLVEAHEARIEATLASDRADAAVSLAQSLVEAEPLRERPRALLMRALHAAGRQAEALRIARAYRRYLADETGLEASDDLAELEERIARDDPNLTGSVRPLRGYELGERIGEGAYSVVHRAVQPGVERDVAVKIIRPELADRPDFIRRFEFEARTVARIEHPNVVPIIDFWREPGGAFLVMRLLDGGSVDQVLRRDGPFTPQRVLRLLDDVGGALDTAHRLSVVHRDVRPANLLLDTTGTAYLGDFGIALPTAAVDDSPAYAAPAYAAPEVLRNDPVSAAADVFSLGVTVFELLAGRTPFAETFERRDLIRRQLTEPVPAVSSIRADVPSSLDVVLARATAKDPTERHASVAAFVDEVHSVLGPPTGTIRRSDVSWVGDAENPYVGLHRFDEEDSGRFFGREQLVTELVETMARRRLVVVVGPSGSGKSSVVRAGLLPEIRRGAVEGSEQWFVAPMLPGGDPVSALETALLRVAVNPPPSLREQLAVPGGLLRAIRRVLPDDESRLLLVVDQFEELFTQVDDPQVRDRFLAELATAVTDPRSPLRVVATLRADHYDAPLRDPNLAELVTDGTVTVRPMTPAELERAITRPAAAVGVDVEPALTNELVAGLSASPAALPLLQFSLTELFDRRVADTMLLSSHEELGGLAGALAARAERILDGLDPEDVDAARRVFGRLAAFGENLDDRRRRAARSEFGDDQRTVSMLDAFIDARLLTTDRDAGTRQPTVEVAHEALLREWPRLRVWLAEDRDIRRSVGAIGEAAGVWEAGGRRDTDLYRGPRLDDALDIADRAGERLLPIDHDFLAASRRHAAAERESERRRLRRLRRLVVGTAAALVMALIAGAVAVSQQRRADRQATAAEEQAEEAEQARSDAEAETARAEAATDDAELSELFTRASAAAADRPDRAMLLALEAHRRAPGPETTRLLLDTVAAGRTGSLVRTFDRLPERECGAIVFQRHIVDGGRMEHAVVDGELLRLDLTTGEVTNSGSSPYPCGGWWGADAGGRRWASAPGLRFHSVDDGSGAWTEISVTTPATTGTGRVVPAEIARGPLAFAEVGGHFLFGQGEPDQFGVVHGETVIVDSRSLREVAPSLDDFDWRSRPDQLVPLGAGSDEAGAFAVAFRQDVDSSSDPALDTPDSLVAVLDATDGSERFRVPHPSSVYALSFADDGQTLYFGDDAGNVVAVDVGTGTERSRYEILEGRRVLAVGERASDGAVIAVNRESIEIFDAAGGRRELPIEIGLVEEAHVRSDGTVIVVPVANSDTLQLIDPNGGPLVEAGWDVGDAGLVGFGVGRAATVDADGNVRIVDLESGTRADLELRLSNEQRFVPIAAVPEENGLLAWDDGRTVARWRDGTVSDEASMWTRAQVVRLTREDFVTDILGIQDGGGDGGLPVLSGGFAGSGAAMVFDEGESKAAYSFDPSAPDLMVRQPLVTPPFIATSVAPAPNGGLYVGMATGTMRSYDADGQRIDEIETGLMEPFVAVTDDVSGLVALGGADGAAVVDPLTGERVVLSDVGPVVSMGFVRDGSMLVVIDADGTVRLWDLEGDRLVGTLWVGNGTAPSSPPWYDETTDSVWVATSGNVLRFGLDVERWTEQICQLVSRELTAEEWERLVPGDEPQRPACE